MGLPRFDDRSGLARRPDIGSLSARSLGKPMLRSASGPYLHIRRGVIIRRPWRPRVTVFSMRHCLPRHARGAWLGRTGRASECMVPSPCKVAARVGSGRSVRHNINPNAGIETFAIGAPLISVRRSRRSECAAAGAEGIRPADLCPTF